MKKNNKTFLENGNIYHEKEQKPFVDFVFFLQKQQL